MSLAIPEALSSLHLLLVVAILLVLLFTTRRRTTSQPFPHPPGPWPLPFIGNTLDMPPSRFPIAWTKFGMKYGPLTWLQVPSQSILVINSFEVAKELLEKRALIYIDRPRFTMLNELLELDGYLSFSGYNDTWRKQRAYLKQPLSAAVVRSDYSSFLESKARQYLERCLVRPESFIVEANRIVAETVIKLTYGRLEDDQGRDYIQINTHILDIIGQVAQGYVVDLLPALRYLPGWLPGAKFKRDAARWKREINEVEHTVFESIRENTLSDNPEVRSAFMFKRLKEIYRQHDETGDEQKRTEDETALARSGLSFFLAGVETTQITIETFIRAMALFPLTQKLAQDEIDRVVGSERFPTFEDQPNLPYLHAVVLEALRWNPVAPSAIPHATRKDDIYNGYFIPRGTSIIPNAWGFSRDPKYYTNPSVFDPQRHLKQPAELDPREFCFGYGRRICPGKDLAFQQVWIMTATVLWAFQLVGDPNDPTSVAEDVDRFSLGTLSRPMPFKCQFIPRREGLKDKLGAASL